MCKEAEETGLPHGKRARFASSEHLHLPLASAAIERIPGPYYRNELVPFFLSLLLFVSYSHRPITPRDGIANAFFPCLSSEEE